MEFESLKKENLSNLVKENLKLYFVKNNLRGGDPLPSEAELATSLGVSRTSVREGLKSLESLGIIEVHPGIGRFLRKFNFDSILENLTYSIEMEVRDFRDILEVRIALESAFIGDNIDRYTDAQIKELEDIISAMQKLDSDGGSEASMIQIHTLFHLALYRGFGNQLLLNLIKIFSTVQRSLTVMNRYHTTDMKEFIQLHEKIIQAIRAKDPQLARSALIHHFKEALEWSEMELSNKASLSNAKTGTDVGPLNASGVKDII